LRASFLFQQLDQRLSRAEDVRAQQSERGLHVLRPNGVYDLPMLLIGQRPAARQDDVNPYIPIGVLL
jgi:hypothetical protein